MASGPILPETNLINSIAYGVTLQWRTSVAKSRGVTDGRSRFSASGRRRPAEAVIHAFQTCRTNIEHDPPDGKRVLDLKPSGQRGRRPAFGGLKSCSTAGLNRPTPLEGWRQEVNLRAIKTQRPPGAARRPCYAVASDDQSGKRVRNADDFAPTAASPDGSPIHGPLASVGQACRAGDRPETVAHWLSGRAFPCFGRLNRLVS